MTKLEAEKNRLSKKITKCVLAFWIIYRVLTLGVGFFKPEIIQGLNALTTGIDDAAMVCIISYLVHSGTENALRTYFDHKGKERVALYGGNDEDEEEGGNG